MPLEDGVLACAPRTDHDETKNETIKVRKRSFFSVNILSTLGKSPLVPRPAYRIVDRFI
jgi:hypothetical protein